MEANNLLRSQLAVNANYLEIVKSWMNLQRRVTLLFDSSKAIGYPYGLLTSINKNWGHLLVILIFVWHFFDIFREG